MYPLQRLVQGSEYSAVFLTERKGQPVASAALKITPIERITLAQLAHWRSATGLSHPHLVQLFDAGLCQLAGRRFLFVVMEYGEQTLSDVLSQRALTADEAREMLAPTLDALTFLHRQGLILGHLKPANVLVVNDQLKLASDGIRPSGAPRVGGAGPSFYDPPEASFASFGSADDIWGLGVTLIEALTQRLPGQNAQASAAWLPDTVPAAFVDTVQRCLSYTAAARPSAADLQAQFFGRAPEPSPPPVPPPEPATRGRRTPAIVALGVLLLAAAGWVDLRLFHTHANAPPAASGTVPPPAAAPQIAAPIPTAPVATPAAVHVHTPDIARSALKTIRGHIRITVLVAVDRSGAVVDAHLKNTGPSSYFARLALQGATQSTFPPAAVPGTRRWLLRYEFTRSGGTGLATPQT
jgi:serine/threonine protein kinase